MTRLLLPTPVLGSKSNAQPGETEETPLLGRAPEAVRSDGGLMATLLLVDRALRRAGILPQDLTALCRRPGTMLTLHSKTKGFGDLARKLLLDDAILPGRVQILEIGDMRAPSRSPFNKEQDCDWHILTRTLSADDRWDRGTETRAIGPEQEETEHLAAATRSGYPLIVLGSSFEVTPLIRLASQHCLDAGEIDSALLAQTIATVCGLELRGIEERLSALPAPDLRFGHLPLDDLSVAIRPGLPLDRVIELLGRFARRASATAAAAVAEADDGDEAGGLGSARRLDGAGTKANSKSGRSSDAGRASSSKSSVGSSSERTRSDKDAGSIVIEPEPEPAPGDGPSAAAARPRMTVETMAGIGAARSWALDLKADLDLWHSGAIAWDALSTRLLLHGPPGTGKTSFARALANTLNLPLHVASVQVWLEPGYLGSVLKRMSAAFAGAEAAAPAILFIDEADAIGRRQPDTREYSDYWNAIVNRMLELMDGAVKSPGVIVVGATNRPEALDAALTRSGRWERQIALPRPDRAALAGIIAHHLGPDLAGLTDSDAAEANAATMAAGQTGIPPIALAQDPATSRLLQDLSRRAVGRSGADIERLVREARGRARRETRALTFADLEAAFEGERPKLSEGLRRRMAIHEAGHAVVRHALALGTVLDLSIEDAGGGYAISRNDLDVEQDEAWMMAQMAALLGGRAAEDIILGSVTTGSGGDETSDLAAATRLALSLELETGFGSERPLTHRSSVGGHRLLLTDGPESRAVELRLGAALAHAKAVLNAHRSCLLRLADALQAAGSLDTGEIAALLDGVDVGPTDGVTDAADEA